jgi:hypothetical protein
MKFMKKIIFLILFCLGISINSVSPDCKKNIHSIEFEVPLGVEFSFINYKDNYFLISYERYKSNFIVCCYQIALNKSEKTPNPKNVKIINLKWKKIIPVRTNDAMIILNQDFSKPLLYVGNGSVLRVFDIDSGKILFKKNFYVDIVDLSFIKNNSQKNLAKVVIKTSNNSIYCYDESFDSKNYLLTERWINIGSLSYFSKKIPSLVSMNNRVYSCNGNIVNLLEEGEELDCTKINLEYLFEKNLEKSRLSFNPIINMIVGSNGVIGYTASGFLFYITNQNNKNKIVWQKSILNGTKKNLEITSIVSKNNKIFLAVKNLLIVIDEKNGNIIKKIPFNTDYILKVDTMSKYLVVVNLKNIYFINDDFSIVKAIKIKSFDKIYIVGEYIFLNSGKNFIAQKVN